MQEPVASKICATKALSFTEYKRKMENQRATFYRPVAKKKRIKCQEEVTVNVGIKKITESGQLKQVKGKLLPIKAEKSLSADSLLQLAVKKHQVHNAIGSGPFNLLYPNNIEVKTLLEKEEPFTLEKYKLEVGRPYHRINFHLVHILDFIKFHTPYDCMSDDESNSSGEKRVKEVASVSTKHEEKDQFYREKGACPVQSDQFIHAPDISECSVPNVPAIIGTQGQEDAFMDSYPMPQFSMPNTCSSSL